MKIFSKKFRPNDKKFAFALEFQRNPPKQTLYASAISNRPDHHLHLPQHKASPPASTDGNATAPKGGSQQSTPTKRQIGENRISNKFRFLLKTSNFYKLFKPSVQKIYNFYSKQNQNKAFCKI